MAERDDVIFIYHRGTGLINGTKNIQCINKRQTLQNDLCVIHLSVLYKITHEDEKKC